MMANDRNSPEEPRADLAHARHFIELLTGSADTQCSWQTFDDQGDRKRGYLARVFNGPLQHNASELTRLSAQGAGVFVTINATDLLGRQSQNIVGLRAIFVDSDSGPLDLQALPVPPSIVVNSARGQHAYWLLVPGQPLDRFTEAQEHLAEALGTDPKIKDLPRVMRVPGFLHRKESPFLVTVASADPSLYYTIDQVLANLPPRKAKPQEPWAEPAFSFPQGSGGSSALERCRRYFDAIPGANEGSGGDHATYRAACVAVRGFNLNDSDALGVLREWNSKCSPPWDSKDLEAKVAHARKYGRGAFGSKLIDIRPRLAAVPQPTSHAPIDGHEPQERKHPKALNCAELIKAWRDSASVAYIATGIAPIDEALGGGLPLGQVTTVMGGTGVGKSEFVRQVSRSIARAGSPVLHVDVELNERIIVDRDIAQVAQIAGKALLDRDGWTGSQTDSIESAILDLEKLPIWTLSTEPMPIQDIELTIRETLALMPEGPRLVILDSIQRLSVGIDADQQRLQVQGFMHWVTSLAKNTGATFLLTSEKKRQGVGDNDDINAAAESRAIEYQSDILIALNSLDSASDEIAGAADTGWERRVSVNILKNRRGQHGRAPGDLAFTGPCWGMRAIEKQDERIEKVLEWFAAGQGWSTAREIEKGLKARNGSLTKLLKSMASSNLLESARITGQFNSFKYKLPLSRTATEKTDVPGTAVLAGTAGTATANW